MTPSGDGGGAVQGAPGGAAPKTAQQDGGGGFPGMMMLPLVIMFALMYFLVMRPEKKRQKEAQSMRSNLKKGDRVLLTGGMLGDVAGMGDDWITVEIADKVRVQFQRSAVVSIIEARSTSDASVASSK
ncbi:MAG: preprotein translocase subunit YajC [Planctomycetes bacterium]|nr:preprotein translocase subunit YajC [Planctomycetota bacterium]